MWNWQKTSRAMFYNKLEFLNFNQRLNLLKFLEYTVLLHSFVKICFYFEKGTHYSYFSFFFLKKRDKNEMEKNVRRRLYGILTLILSV